MARKPAIKQFSFAGGEISPKLFGRTDLERYRQSMQACRNFIVEATGVATNRPGTKFVAETKDSTKASRLLPFTALNGQAYAIEVGDYYMRFHSLGAPLTWLPKQDAYHDGGAASATLIDSSQSWTPGEWVGARIHHITDGGDELVSANTATEVTHAADGAPSGPIAQWDDGDWARLYRVDSVLVELVTPWAAEDVAELDYAQQNDLMFITHRSYPPQILKRLADGSWTIEPFSTQKSILPPTNVAFETAPQASDGTHPNMEWDWVVVSVDAAGNKSLPSDPLQSTAATLYSDFTQVVIDWVAPTQGNAPVSYDIYRGRNGIYGYVGSSNEIRFVEPNVVPDFSESPPQARDPSTETITVIGAADSIIREFSGSTMTKDTTPESYNKKYTVNLRTNGTTPGSWLVYKVEFKTSVGSYVEVATGTLITGYSSPDTYASIVVAFDGMDLGSSVRVTKVAADGAGFFDPIIEPLNVRWTEEGLAESTISSYPALVSFYEQRTVFGNFRHNAQLLRLSRTGDLLNFDQTSPLRDDDSFDLVLAATTLDEIMHVVPGRGLGVLTSSGEWVARGPEGLPLTPSSFDLKKLTSYGAGVAKALTIADTIIYASDRGRSVREMMIDPYGSQNASRDLTVMTEHLFRDATLLDLQYADVPFNVLWALRSDGVLLGLTYQREHNVFAWHRHDTGGLYTSGTPRDKFESLATVPEGGEVSVYVIVKRTMPGVNSGNPVRYVELMAPRRVVDPKDAIFMDSALSYDGRYTGASQLKLRSLTGTHDHPDPDPVTLQDGGESWSEDEWVGNTILNTTDGSSGTCISNDATHITVDDLTGGTNDEWQNTDAYEIVPTYAAQEKLRIIPDAGTPFVAGDEGTQLELRLQVLGTVPDANGELSITNYSLRVTVTNYLSPVLMEVTPETAVISQFQGVFVEDWGRAPSTFSGLDHLEGETVAVIVDGATHQKVTVSSGAITLDSGVYAERAHVGIPYISEMISMPLDIRQDEGSLRISKKIITAVGVEVDDYRGMFVGHKRSKMVEAQQRAVASEYETISEDNAIVLIRPKSGYSRSVNIIVQQRDPLPLTLMSLIVEVEAGGNQ